MKTPRVFSGGIIMSRCFKCMRELKTTDSQCPDCRTDNRALASRQLAYALPCGTLLHNRYMIGQVLGQGGFGIAYIAWDTALETRVCIKEYFPRGAAIRDASYGPVIRWSAGERVQSLRQGRDSFLKEARKAVKLRDLPSVVTVWDVFQDNDTAYIVMDYIEGLTLLDYLKQSGKLLGESACLTLFAPVMTDLEKIHRRGIIHRDISPDNLKLCPDGRLILLDIGAAKDLSAGSGQNSHLVAKRGFSPVEQYTPDREIGSWTDVYAMCATVVYCVSGRLLPEPMERLMGKSLDLSAFSPAVADVLEKGLAVKPEDRIKTMGELQALLQAALRAAPPGGQGDEDSLELNYQNAAKLMAQGDKDSLCAALDIFSALGLYRDAAAKAEECGQKLKSIDQTDQAEPSDDGPGPEPEPSGRRQAFWAYTVIILSLLGAILFAYRGSAQESGSSQQNVSGLTSLTRQKQLRSVSGQTSASGQKQLSGSRGEWQAIHNGLSRPFILSEAVYDCTDLTMELTLTEYTGYPFGNWYLYSEDLNDRWEHIGEFRIEKEQADGEMRSYSFHFDTPQSFKALALCIRDKGNEFTYSDEIRFYR